VLTSMVDENAAFTSPVFPAVRFAAAYQEDGPLHRPKRRASPASHYALALALLHGLEGSALRLVADFSGVVRGAAAAERTRGTPRLPTNRLTACLKSAGENEVQVARCGALEALAAARFGSMQQHAAVAARRVLWAPARSLLCMCPVLSPYTRADFPPKGARTAPRPTPLPAHYRPVM